MSQFGQGGGVRVQWPKPQKGVRALLIATVVAYVLQLIVMRTGVNITGLMMSPDKFLTQGYLWQPLTYMFLHAHDAPFHMLFNMLWLWLFGPQLETWWGTRRFVRGYFIFGLSGALMILLLGGLDAALGMGGTMWTSHHLGASGAVMGITVSWGLVYGNQEMNFLFLGRMKGKNFVFIIIGIELLTALSFQPAVSSAAHFGGIAGAFVVCKGLWKLSGWKGIFKHGELKRRRKAIEHELRILEGGKGKPPDDKKKWN